MLIAYCTGLIVVCTLLLVPATIFSMKNYWLLRDLMNQPSGKHDGPPPLERERERERERAVPVRSAPQRSVPPRPLVEHKAPERKAPERTFAYYDSGAIGDGDGVEWTGPVVPYTPQPKN